MTEEQSASSLVYRDEWSDTTQRAPMSRITLVVELVLVLLPPLVDRHHCLLYFCQHGHTSFVSGLHSAELVLSDGASGSAHVRAPSVSQGRQQFEYQICLLLVVFLPVHVRESVESRVWCVVLVYTNVLFYGNPNLKDEHYLIFISLMSITVYGYLILLETAILILILFIFFIILRLQKGHELNPIPKVVQRLTLGASKETSAGQMQRKKLRSGQRLQDLSRRIYKRLHDNHTPLPLQVCSSSP